MTDILTETNGPVAQVTLNRPRQRNALTLAMWRDLAAAFTRLGADTAVHAVVLTGAGADFTAGADIVEFDTLRTDAAQARAYEAAVDAACEAIAACPKPVIAACRGYTLGGGAHVAMAADFRFAAPEANFGIPAARLSIVYGIQGTRRLLALVGLTEAKRILYGGHRFDAARALEIGFVDAISQDPLAEALARAADLAATSAPMTIAGAKMILNGETAGGFDADALARLMDKAAASDDYREGRAAFAERRAPRFRGQ